MSKQGLVKRANLDGTFAQAFHLFCKQTLVNAVKFSVIFAVVISLWTYIATGAVSLDVVDTLGFALGFAVLTAFFEIILPWLQNNEPSDPMAEGTKAILENRNASNKSEQLN